MLLIGRMGHELTGDKKLCTKYFSKELDFKLQKPTADVPPQQHELKIAQQLEPAVPLASQQHLKVRPKRGAG